MTADKDKPEWPLGRLHQKTCRRLVVIKREAAVSDYEQIGLGVVVKIPGDGANRCAVEFRRQRTRLLGDICEFAGHTTE